MGEHFKEYFRVAEFYFGSGYFLPGYMRHFPGISGIDLHHSQTEQVERLSPLISTLYARGVLNFHFGIIVRPEGPQMGLKEWAGKKIEA